MLSNQCFAVKNLAFKSQVRFLSRVRCLPKEQQQTFSKTCCFRVNAETIRCITTDVQCKPVELIKKCDNLFKNVYVGSYLSSERSIHCSNISYQKSNQDDEKQKNNIFIGVIVFFVVAFIICSLTVEEHADYVKVKSKRS